MIGLEYEDFITALKDNHEIEFTYQNKHYVIQPEQRDNSYYLVIWSTGGSPFCIAETRLSGNGDITDDVITDLLSQKCFYNLAFLDIKDQVTIETVY